MLPLFRRRSTLPWILLLAFTGDVLTAPSPAIPGEGGERPNIVFILIDDMGYADPACFGSDLHETPNIDRLAASGTRFTQGYAASPVCSPTRASVMTGKHPARLRLTNFLKGGRSPKSSPILPADYADELPLEELTIAEVLRTAGYATGHFGKWHLGGEPYRPEHQGFDVNVGGTHSGMPRSFFWPRWGTNPPIEGRADGEYLPDRLAEEACRFIEEHREGPFFVYLSHYAVHIPIEGKPEKVAKYRFELDERDDAARAAAVHTNAEYAAMVESVDDSVGRVLDTLERLDIDERTLVVFFSDNGGLVTREGKHTPATSCKPFRAGKGYLYEGGVREPMIVRWPGVTPQGSVCDAPVMSIDFFPTLCEVAGLDPAKVGTNGPIDGRSIVELLRDPSGRIEREALFWHYPHFSNQGGKPGGAVRVGDWKLIERFENGRLELYDLASDVGETRDLAESMPDKARELQRRLAAWRAEVNANLPKPNPMVGQAGGRIIERPERGRFRITELVRGMPRPLEIEALPDGRVMWIELAGRVRIVDPATLEVTTALELDVFADQENGLIGMALDPEFESNGWLYLLHSPHDFSGQHLSRFTFDGERIDPATQKVLLTYEEQRIECCHHAGSLEFGPDGCLFIATGDNTHPFGDSASYAPIDERPGREPWDAQKSSANTATLVGKILRIRPTPGGSYEIPEGNLFPADGSGGRPEIYVMGCRNPWRISVDQRTGYLYWGEVGPDAGGDGPRGPRGYDEINQARAAGNFGWPYFIADNQAYADVDFSTGEVGARFDPERPVNDSPNNTGARVLPPAEKAFIWYPYADSPLFPALGSGGRTACAGPVYHFDPSLDSPTKLPAHFDDHLFIWDWQRHAIVAVGLDADSRVARMERFLADVPFQRPVDMVFDADGSMLLLEYGSTWGDNADSRLVRIDYFAGNRPPTARATATGTVGKAPLRVELSSAGTSDPDEGDELTYRWQLDPPTGPVISEGPSATFVFDAAGVHNVQLRVEDAEGAAATATVPVLVGNGRPRIEVKEPLDGAFFEPGRPLRYHVHVVDPEDGDSYVEFAAMLRRSSIETSFHAGPPSRAEDESSLPPGLRRMRRSDCFNCHAVDRKVVGPALRDVALKYRGVAGALEASARRVLEGSSKVWSEVPMLPHAQHSLDEAKEMVAWVYSLADSAPSISVEQGLIGELTPRVDRDAAGTLTLTARYADAGAPPVGSLVEAVTVSLRTRRVEAEHFDERRGTQTLEAGNAGGGQFVGDVHHGQALRFARLPLQDVERVTMRVASAGAGGDIELRVGAPDGPLVGRVRVESTGGWERWVERTTPIAATAREADGASDLWVTFVNPGRGGLLNLDWLHFHGAADAESE